MNYFEHHIGDYDEATAHLTACEDGIYHRLLRKYYATQRPLIAEVAKLQRLVRARSEEEQKAVVDVLEEFFHLEADGWHQDTCDEAIAAYLAGEPEREIKKANENNRMQRYREERSRLFKAITDAGQHAPWNTGMAELRELVTRLPVTKPATPATDAVTQPATATATPATATHSPYTIPHTPKRKNTGAVPAPIFALPEWIDRGHWDAWHSSPKRKKATDEQKQLAVDKLAKWRKSGLNHAGALENAALGAYQGLFLPDAKRPAGGATAPQQDWTAKPEWVTRAGFEDIADANASRCYAHNAHEFRDGKRIQEAIA